MALDHDDGGSFTDPAGLLARVQAYAPQVIVNAAAHTAGGQGRERARPVRQINASTLTAGGHRSRPAPRPRPLLDRLRLRRQRQHAAP